MRFSIVAAAFMLPLALAAPLAAPAPPSIDAFVGLRGGFDIVSTAVADATDAFVSVAPDPADADDFNFVAGSLNGSTLKGAIGNLKLRIVTQGAEPFDNEYVDTLSFVTIIDTLFTFTASLLSEKRSTRLGQDSS